MGDGKLTWMSDWGIPWSRSGLNLRDNERIGTHFKPRNAMSKFLFYKQHLGYDVGIWGRTKEDESNWGNIYNNSGLAQVLEAQLMISIWVFIINRISLRDKTEFF